MSAAAGEATRQAAKNIARQARKEVQKTWQHVQLRELPQTATPDDVRRMLRHNRVESVTQVQLDLHRFLPTGRAYLTLAHPDLTGPTLALLRGATLSSLRVDAKPSAPPNSGPDVQPTRGVKGFARAADRGAITGNGPSGGVSGGGKNVLIRGLPAKLTHDELREHLRGFQLAPEDRGQRVVVKLDMDGAMGYSVTSRHFVKMGTESEAYRLVRKWHMMPFLPQQNGDRYIVRAQIIH